MSWFLERLCSSAPLFWEVVLGTLSRSQLDVPFKVGAAILVVVLIAAYFRPNNSDAYRLTRLHAAGGDHRLELVATHAKPSGTPAMNREAARVMDELFA